jgi:hypothetical protein
MHTFLPATILLFWTAAEEKGMNLTKKNRKKITTCWVLLFICVCVSAQEIDFKAGFSRMMMLDLHASPLVLNSNGITAEIEYSHNNPRHIFYAGGIFMYDWLYPDELGQNKLAVSWINDKGERESVIREIEYNNIGGTVSIGFLYRIPVLNTPQNEAFIDVGVNVKELLRYSLSEQQHGMMNVIALNLESRYECSIQNKHKLEISASFPLTAALTRLPHSSDPTIPDRTFTYGFFKKGTRFAFANTFQDVQCGISYSYQLTPQMALCTGYTFNWLHYTFPNNITIINNNFTFGVKL